MKSKIIMILLLQLCLQSCKAQDKIKTKNNQPQADRIMYPTITKDFETFDNYRYENRKDKTSLVLTEFDANEGLLMIVKLEESRFFLTLKESYFTVVKLYYKTGFIKSKGLGFNANAIGFKKGVWYEFDEQGKLIKEIDYDKDYKFTFEEILKFCESEKIVVKTGPILQSTGFHTSILRNHSATSNESTWTIKWLKDASTIQTIKLDGTTGKVLSRTDALYINN